MSVLRVLRAPVVVCPPRTSHISVVSGFSRTEKTESTEQFNHGDTEVTEECFL